MIADNREFLGAGWALPLGVDGRGGVALTFGEEAIERSIRIILSTAKGERRMRPQFGCGIHDYVFYPNDASTAGLIQTAVADALAWWEPRIEVVDIRVQQHPDEPAGVLIEVDYTVKMTKAERSLVYPFYLIPGED